jgi:ABC-type amino acid transport substrate-binding protein
MAVIAKQGETRFNALSDLNDSNVRIAVNQGGANQRFAKHYCPEAKLTELSTDISQVLSEVIAGRADVAIADTWSVSKFADQNKQSVQILFAGRPLDVTAISWAVRPDETRLLEFLNTSIDYLHTSGQIREFEKRYDAHWLHLKREWERD